MNDKEQLDQMLSQTQDQVKSLENDVAELSEEKTQLEETLSSETARLNDEIDYVRNDLETAKNEAAEMAAAKDAEIEKLTTAVESPFLPYTAKGLQLTEKGGGVYLDQALRFKSGSARLTEESQATLENIAAALIADANARMIVEGHTDDVPMKEGATYTSNKELSLARARAVVRALVKMGVEKNQLTAVGHGSDRPAMAYDGLENKEEAREYNRRAEFSIITSPGELLRISQTL